MSDELNQHMSAMEESATQFLERGISIGEHLLKAQDLLAPDAWEQWVIDNLDFPLNKVQMYMRLARDKDLYRTDAAARDQVLLLVASSSASPADLRLANLAVERARDGRIK